MAGTLYVSGDGLWKLAAGAATPTELPFTDVGEARGVAVDAAGNVYVAEFDNDRVVKLPAAYVPGSR